MRLTRRQCSNAFNVCNNEMENPLNHFICIHFEIYCCIITRMQFDVCLRNLYNFEATPFDRPLHFEYTGIGTNSRLGTCNTNLESVIKRKVHGSLNQIIQIRYLIKIHQSTMIHSSLQTLLFGVGFNYDFFSLQANNSRKFWKWMGQLTNQRTQTEKINI